MKPMILLSLTLLIASTSSQAGTKVVATSGTKKVQLLELYSSEGCSSCPPADKWIATLANDKKLWSSFVPVVFHVDYWNQLGWKDEFSSALGTARQVAITHLWPVQTVYTPGMVLDGKEWQNWRSGDLPGEPTAKSDLRLTVSQSKELEFNVEADGASPKESYVIHAAVLGMNVDSKVTSGENSGKTLQHSFIVIDWKYSSLKKGTKNVSFDFSEVKARKEKHAIAVWIERDSSPVPLQAAGGFL